VVVVVGCVNENDCGGGGCLELSREQGLLSKCEYCECDENDCGGGGCLELSICECLGGGQRRTEESAFPQRDSRIS
jgi:hypothetical protein